MGGGELQGLGTLCPFSISKIVNDATGKRGPMMAIGQTLQRFSAHAAQQSTLSHMLTHTHAQQITSAAG